MPANGYAYSAIATGRVPSVLSLLFGHIANYQVRKRGLVCAPFAIENDDLLPRQARDKHKKKTLKNGATIRATAPSMRQNS
jgi:hypothetical protein